MIHANIVSYTYWRHQMSKYMQERQKLRIEASTNVDLLTETGEGAGKWKGVENLSQADPRCQRGTTVCLPSTRTSTTIMARKKTPDGREGRAEEESKGCVEGRVNSVEGLECV